MVPRTILRHLARLRWRERWIRFAWGSARWIALVLAVLALACLTDWLIDRRRDTPLGLREGMLIGQLVIAVTAAVVFIARPLFRRLSDSRLALRVEDRFPQFGHRLISAVQLNQRGAVTEGMSPELIAVVTREAEDRAAQVDFARVADHRRLKWGAALGIPVVLAALIALAGWPETVKALLSRQLLADASIPRAVTLKSLSPTAWPRGDDVILRFRVIGVSEPEGVQGEVRVDALNGPSDRYPLTLERQPGPGQAIFLARVPAPSGDFAYHAWLQDGRTHLPSQVFLVPRPVVIDLHAQLLLPRYVEHPAEKPRRPYEEEQPRGDILGIPGSSARVVVKVQKPITHATLELLGVPDAEGLKPETVLRRLEVKVPRRGRRAEWTFDLRPTETAYRVVVLDRYGFANVPPPRRTIRIIPEDPPQVALLREQFRPGKQVFTGLGTSEDFEVEGMPVPLGGPFRVAYTCTGPYGLGRATMNYRINDEETWRMLPLQEVFATQQTGPFDPTRGAFTHSQWREQVAFHAVPSPDPQKVLGRKQGGGRFDFQTRGIPDGMGGYLDLKAGDRIEYYVEVFADSDPASQRPSARSETRVKTMVTGLEFARWMDDTLQEERRIRQLEARQRGLFDP